MLEFAKPKSGQVHLQSDLNWHPLRIDVDYTFSNRFIERNPSLDVKYRMAKKIIESVKKYFQSLAQVYYRNSISFPGGACFSDNLPSFEKQADLVVFLSTETDPETEYNVASTACYLSDVDERPTIGALVINYAFLELGDIQEFLYFSSFAHEFTHLLGFSSSLFSKYVIPGSLTKRTDVLGTVTIGQEKFTAITMPEVVDFARQYFGCDQLEGMPLENNGGSGISGSHWEKLFLPQEYMNHISENPAVISEFSLVLLRGSGWYKIDTGAAEKYSVGKGEGCSRFSICPTNSDDFCTADQASQTMCAPNFMGKAGCVRDTEFGSGCYFKKAKMHSCMMANFFQQDATESYGLGSRCLSYVTNGVHNAKCHQVSLVNDEIVIKIGSESVVCKADEKGVKKTVNGQESLECPDVAKFSAHLEQACPNDCSAHGMCRQDKVCSCFQGWEGNDCSIKTPDGSSPIVQPAPAPEINQWSPPQEQVDSSASTASPSNPSAPASPNGDGSQPSNISPSTSIDPASPTPSDPSQNATKAVEPENPSDPVKKIEQGTSDSQSKRATLFYLSWTAILLVKFLAL